MTKGEAALLLCKEARKDELTAGGYSNAKRALRVLEVTEATEREEVLMYLGFHYEAGKAFTFLTKRAGR